MSGATVWPEQPRVADLLEQLGDISPRRVLLQPPPGTATEADLLRQIDRKESLCELIDATLVEKPVGAPEAGLAAWLGWLLGSFVYPNDLGLLFGADAPFRLMAGLVRLPDLTFIRREKLPGGRLPTEAVPEIAPDLAIEILSESNTAGEMLRKRTEYFLAGTTLVWIVDPRSRSVTVYTEPEVSERLKEGDTLDGGTVLPGLLIEVTRIFEKLPPATRVRRSRKKKQ